MMSEPWKIFQRAWDHGYNVGYLRSYAQLRFMLNACYIYSVRKTEPEDMYKKLVDEGFFDWYLGREVTTK